MDFSETLSNATAGAARRVELSVIYQEEGSARLDISAQMQASLSSLTYKESLRDSSQSFTLDLSFADPTGFFRRTLTFDTYATLDVTISMHNWGISSAKLNRKLPQMYINGVTVDSSKGAGTSMRLNCSSIQGDCGFRTEKNCVIYPSAEVENTSQEQSGKDVSPTSKATTDSAGSGDSFSDEPYIAGTVAEPTKPKQAKRIKKNTTTLKDAAGDMAKRQGWKLKYLAKENPEITVAEQHTHSASRMLHKFVSQNDMFYSVTDKKLNVVSYKDIEQSTPVAVLLAPAPGIVGGICNSGLTSYTFNRSCEDTYGQCTACYTDPYSGETVTATVKDANLPANAPTLHKDDHPYSAEEAAAEEFDREWMD
jgi:hypothetical protein